MASTPKKLLDLLSDNHITTFQGNELLIVENGDGTGISILNDLVSFITRNSAKIVAVPSSATSNGTAGAVAYDSNYLYICVSANNWKRIAISSW